MLEVGVKAPDFMFMCKCKMFADRFRVPKYSGILINDKTLLG